MPAPRRLDRFGYGAVAGVYETLARAYSLGRIQASRRGQLAWLAPGTRVLYAGVGPGEDALAAARAGVRVTAVDVSSAMLRRLARKLEREGLAANLVRGDVAEHASDEPYDAVVANYFLNLFDADGARAMARRLVTQLRPGGRLLLADFARPCGGRMARAWTSAYYRPVNGLAWAARLCELHPIHDHRALLGSLDLQVVAERRYPVLRAGPAYVAIAAIRP